jgi:hypothetical protein
VFLAEEVKMCKHRGLYFSQGLILLLFFLLRCTFESPKTPSWDVNFYLPILNDTYTMEEWIDDEDRLIMDPDQSIFYKLEKDIDSVGIRNALRFDDVDQTDTLLVPFGSQDPVWTVLILKESIIAEEAELRQGLLRIHAWNDMDVPLRVTILLPFLHLSGSVSMYEVVINLNPYESRFVDEQDLAGAIVDPPIVDRYNLVQYGVRAEYTGPARPLPSLARVRVNINMTGLVLQRLRGGLDGLAIPMDAQVDTLNLPDELDGIMLGPVNGLLYVFSTYENMPADIRVKLVARRDDGLADSLQFEMYDLSADNIMSDTTTWNKTPLTGLESIINIYPKYLDIKGEVIVGKGYDPDHPVDISFDDFVLGHTLIKIPLIFQFMGIEPNEVPVDTLDLYDEEDPDKTQTNEIIRDNVNSAGIIALAENHFPMGAKVTFIFSSERGDSTIYSGSDPSDVVKTLDLKPGQTGGGNGTPEEPNIVITPSSNTFDLVLSADEVKLFESPEVYIGTRIQFYPTNSMVEVLPTDYLILKVRMEASLNTKIPEEDDEEGGAL